MLCWLFVCELMYSSLFTTRFNFFLMNKSPIITLFSNQFAWDAFLTSMWPLEMPPFDRDSSNTLYGPLQTHANGVNHTTLSSMRLQCQHLGLYVAQWVRLFSLTPQAHVTKVYCERIRERQSHPDIYLHPVEG